MYGFPQVFSKQACSLPLYHKKMKNVDKITVTIIKTLIQRGLDPDQHGSAFNWHPGSGSAWNGCGSETLLLRSLQNSFVLPQALNSFVTPDPSCQWEWSTLEHYIILHPLEFQSYLNILTTLNTVHRFKWSDQKILGDFRWKVDMSPSLKEIKKRSEAQYRQRQPVTPAVKSFYYTHL
jgi:hypothetical protein